MGSYYLCHEKLADVYNREDDNLIISFSTEAALARIEKINYIIYDF